MEQLLNLTWVLVSLALVGAWLWHRTRNHRDDHGPGLLRQMVALSLVLLLLFFAISIADDLQWSPVATDALEGQQKILRVFAGKTLETLPVIQTAALLTAVALVVAESRAGFADPVASFGSPAAGFVQDFSDRSPPSFS